MRKTVTHLIIGLAKGGAETMLYQVLKYRSDPDLDYRVISLGASHYYEEPIRQLGYEVLELNLRRHPVRTFWQLCRALRGTDTLCCWMYHANFLGYLAARLAGVKRVIWCIRHSDLDPSRNKARSLKLIRFCARWSGKVAAISYNGEVSRSVHEAIGYDPSHGMVLDNGCDLTEYAPDAEARQVLVRELGIPQGAKIVLSVTKDSPFKDVPTFLRAFAALRKTERSAVAVLCGLGITPDQERLAALCRELSLQVGQDVYLLGLRHDVPKLMAGCDLYVLHSAGEAFPNVLIQAMACGCLCVSTDVGDAGRILGKPEWIVPPGDPTALAEKMACALALPRETAERVKQENRIHVKENFDIRKIVSSYEQLYR